MFSSYSLSQLGWRVFYSQQLSLTDFETGFPARVASVHRGTLIVLSEFGETRVTAPRPIGHDEASTPATSETGR
jgi:hypothetical protein